MYLIAGRWVELEAHLPPEQFKRTLDQEILPSIEMLTQWEEEGKIYGGVFCGERAGAWIIEVESEEEVGRLLDSLPSWGKINWLVRTLEPTRSLSEREWEVRERLRTTLETSSSSLCEARYSRKRWTEDFPRDAVYLPFERSNGNSRRTTVGGKDTTMHRVHQDEATRTEQRSLDLDDTPRQGAQEEHSGPGEPSGGVGERTAPGDQQEPSERRSWLYRLFFGP